MIVLIISILILSYTSLYMYEQYCIRWITKHNKEITNYLSRFRLHLHVIYGPISDSYIICNSFDNPKTLTSVYRTVNACFIKNAYMDVKELKVPKNYFVQLRDMSRKSKK